MKKLKVDWIKAKGDFLLDYTMTLKEVARKYGLSYSKIRNVSAARDWYQDKKQIQKILSDALMKEVQFKITEKQIEEVRKIKPSLGEKYLKRREQVMKRILCAINI